jgi:PAS domain S-box-containing protein
MVVQEAQEREGLRQEVARLRQVEAENRLLLRLAQAISSAPDFDTGLAIALEELCRHASFVVGEVWRPDSAQAALEISPVFYNGDTNKARFQTFLASSGEQRFKPGIGLPGRVWQSQEAMWIGDLTALDGDRYERGEQASQAGLRTAVGVPIMAGDEVLAVFNCYGLERRPRDERLLALLAAVAAQLGRLLKQKQTEEELRRQIARAEISEARFRLAIDNYPAPFVIYDAERRYRFVNTQALILGGYAEAAMIGRTDEALFPAGVTEAYLPLLRAAVATGIAQTGECRLELPAGLFTMIITYVPLYDREGRLEQLLGIYQDITERKQAEEKLQEYAHNLEGLHEQVRRHAAELEQRVAERTARLLDTNVRLAREIEERTQAETAEREQRTLAEALRDTIGALNSTLELEEVLDRILDNVGQVVPHDAASVTLLEKGVARVVRSRGRADLAARTASRLHAPIRLEGEAIGFLNLSSAQPHFFSGVHAERLDAFADQAAMAIRNAQLYTQAQQLATMQERERLARELHDAVSQTLWSASLIADVLPDIWEKDADLGRARLARLSHLTQGALAEMRTLLLELRPAALEEASLDELLQQLVAAAAGRTRSRIHLRAEGGCTLPPAVQVALYRIAQEGLNNAVRHAEASDIKVWLQCRPGYTYLEIGDNGRGFDAEQAPGGGHLGLRIMQERAETAGARLHLHSRPGDGCTLRVYWPDGGPERDHG